MRRGAQPAAGRGRCGALAYRVELVQNVLGAAADGIVGEEPGGGLVVPLAVEEVLGWGR